MNSAIYTGDIFHQRFQPMSHRFKYKIFMAYIDLDEVNILLPQSLFWGVNRSALISFHRQDYLSGSKLDLREDPTWTRIGIFRSMRNNKMFPLQVWALAKK